MTDFDAWHHVERLPERAPIRRIRPDALPKPERVWPRLHAEGIDPDNASGILPAILRRDWTAWLIALPWQPPKFTAYVLEPRLGAVWAMGRGATPAEALGAVFVMCLDEPPWARRPEDEAVPDPAKSGET